MSQTLQQKQALLAKLESAFYGGVLKVREGDTWLEYQTTSQMKLAIEDLRNSISPTVPKGTRLARFTNKGYY